MGIVDFEFAPHWDGSKEYIDLVKKYAETKHTTVYVCKDSGGIIADGDTVKLIGDIEKIEGRAI